LRKPNGLLRISVVLENDVENPRDSRYCYSFWRHIIEEKEIFMPKILIADHDKIIRKSYSEMLKRDGHDVYEASNGSTALRVINKHHLDIALLDIDLPKHGGIALCRELSRSSNTRVILLTKSDKGIDQIIGLDSGADDYQRKSVTLGEIRARINAVLRREKRVPNGIVVDPLFNARELISDPQLCFVIMPFSAAFKPIYEDIIKKVVEKCRLRCLRVDELFAPKPIMECTGPQKLDTKMGFQTS